MNARARAQAREELIERSARQREQLGLALTGMRTPLKIADYALRGAAMLRRYPVAAMGVVAGLMLRRGSLRRTGAGWLARKLFRSFVR